MYGWPVTSYNRNTCDQRGIAWSVATAKLKALEIRLAIVESEHKTDHDLLIEIRTKLDMLLQQIGPLLRGGH